MPTTMEGVETEEQFRAISRWAQGSAGLLFSPPRPADEASRLIAQFGGPPHLVHAASEMTPAIAGTAAGCRRGR